MEENSKKSKGSALKKIAATAVFIVLAAIITVTVQGALMLKSSSYKYTPFIEAEENFDVLFFGTSHMVNGVFPMELWEDYGIVSYNLGNNNATMASEYWELELALEYTSPKLVVIDVYGLHKDFKVENIDQLHVFFDAFPLSVTKIKAVADLSNETEGIPVSDTFDEEMRELLFPILKYHSRWKELESGDFSGDVTPEKGAEHAVDVAEIEAASVTDADALIEEETAGVSYLKKMIEKCLDAGINVLLTYIPDLINDRAVQTDNTAALIAADYGISYLSLEELSGVIDYDTDLYNASATAFHVNASGAYKLTDYIGAYIIQNYDIQSQKENAAYASWQEDLTAYKDYKASLLEEQTDAKNVLMLLSDDDFSAEIVVGESALEGASDGVLSALLENLPGEDTIETETEADEGTANGGKISIAVTRNDTGGAVISAEYEYGKETEEQ